MSLLTAATIVSVGIAVCCLLPHYFTSVRAHSKTLLFIGTAVLLGFVFFDLIPEMMEIGGVTSLLIMALSWALFAGIHALSATSHETHHGSLHNKEEQAHQHHHTISFLLGSMALHCFAGGMLLVSSYAVSQRLATAVFLSLVAHKAFEAISVASLLIERARSKKHLFTCVAAYALSFPIGVAFTAAIESVTAGSLGSENIEKIAMVITSIAIGSLFGCLLQDFLLPSLREFRRLAFKTSQTS